MSFDPRLPARPEDVRFDRDRFAAASFLSRYREPTRGLYTINLRQWFDWCEVRGMRPLEATRAHIELWARDLEELQGLKLSTIANKLNTVAGFYRMAFIDKAIVEDPAAYIRRPTVPRVSNRQSLTRSELLRCIEIAEKAHPQDYAIWCVLAFNGLRVGELCALNVEDIGRQGGYRTIFVNREKGNRAGAVPMAPRTSWAVEGIIGHRTEGPLFRMRYGERADRKAVGRVVARVVKEAGIRKNITPHSLRHTCITLALNAGASIRDIVNTMGYADARQVSYYDRDKDSLSRNATHLVAAYVEGS